MIQTIYILEPINVEKTQTKKLQCILKKIYCKYQILRHFDESPQMPTGYPGMMLLALIPPIWFKIMNKEIKRFNISVCI